MQLIKEGGKSLISRRFGSLLSSMLETGEQGASPLEHPEYLNKCALGFPTFYQRVFVLPCSWETGHSPLSCQGEEGIFKSDVKTWTPGWRSWSRVQILIWAQVMNLGLQDGAPSGALH